MPKARQRKTNRRKRLALRRVARLKKGRQYDLPKRAKRALKTNGTKTRRRSPARSASLPRGIGMRGRALRGTNGKRS